MNYQASFFYNFKTLGDILFIIIDNSKLMTSFKKDKDVVYIYSNDELIGINIFNISLVMKIKSKGLIHFPNKIFIDIVNSLLKDDVKISYPVSSNYVIGRILSVEDHPESSHLKILKVDCKDEILSIVCGAYNCEVNRLGVVCKVGATLRNGEKLVVQNMLGEKSYGMMCSEKDLNLEETLPPHHLLYLDEKEASVGQDFYYFNKGE